MPQISFEIRTHYPGMGCELPPPTPGPNPPPYPPPGLRRGGVPGEPREGDDRAPGVPPLPARGLPPRRPRSGLPACGFPRAAEPLGVPWAAGTPSTVCCCPARSTQKEAGNVKLFSNPRSIDNGSPTGIPETPPPLLGSRSEVCFLPLFYLFYPTTHGAWAGSGKIGGGG